ncbi:MAG: putative Ig domain-containing protein, partial [Anaerolineaceae bacterium]|nr:putative Ig domain-containing protein [Anaerolineaceae bacterium]
MKKNVLIILIVVVFSLVWIAPALADLSPGHLDTGFDTGSGPNNEKVDVLTIASDGKIILAGDFTQFNGISRNRIAKLHGDGTLDTSFNPTPGPNNIILALAVQPDGKVLVGGDFTSMNGVTQSGIARLNANGTLDTSFAPGSSIYNNVTAIALQPDGKVIIACRSLQIDDTWFWKITRLNPDGSLDSAFTATSPINGKIKSIAVEAYGTLIIGGAFTQVAGQARNRIARINANGSLDAGFDPGTGANDVIEAVTVRHDGKIMIAGWFTQFNGLNRYKVARLNSSGSLDLSFNGTVDIINNVVYTLAVQYDGHEGHVVIGGSFTNVLGFSRNRIARLTDDGKIDLSFSPGSGANDTIFTLALEPDNKVVIGGYFSTYNGFANVNHITRVNRDGSRDIAFSQGAIGGVISGDVYSIAQQRNGKTIIGGDFSEYGGEYRKNVARLLANGTLDDSFFPPTDTNDIVRTVAVNEADNSVFIAGEFTLVDGETRNKIARLSSTGSLDLGFDPGNGPNGDIYAMLIQPDGKILIGGDFTTVRNTSRNRIARFNSDGTLDKSFNPGAGASGIVLGFALQDNGKILIGGAFSSYSDTPRNAIALLNADGSLETRFNAGNSLVGFSVTNIAIRPDNKIMIGGEFTSYDGYTRNRVALLNSDGTLDTSFDPGIGPNQAVEALALQSDGKVVIGGWFTTLNNYAQNRLARLNADGSPDPSFNIGAGANSVVYDIAIQPDGKVLIGGNFTTVWGVVNQNRVARLNGATPPVLLTPSLPTATVGEFYTYTLNASSYPFRPRFNITSGDLPTGMNLNPVTGLLYGTPAAGSAGVYPLTLTVSNSVSPNAVHNITLTVVQASTPPSITSLNNTTFMVGNLDTFTVTSTGDPTPTLSKT